MKFSQFTRFAYLPAHGNFEIDEITTALGIKCSNCENIFIFKENPEVMFYLLYLNF